MAAYFVTGTDTGVGKTFVTLALLHAAAARGHRVAGLKPVAAGGAIRDGRAMNDDALRLMAASSVTLDYDTVNPVMLRAAMAPHLAAALEGRVLAIADIAARCRPLLAGGRTTATAVDWLAVEGAGGWLVPLNERETMADLCIALGLPVIMVVALRLGCLNHALLTAAAVRSAGLTLAGWVANSAGLAMLALEENVAALEARLGAPRLGTIPWLGADADPARASVYLDLRKLAA